MNKFKVGEQVKPVKGPSLALYGSKIKTVARVKNGLFGCADKSCCKDKFYCHNNDDTWQVVLSSSLPCFGIIKEEDDLRFWVTSDSIETLVQTEANVDEPTVVYRLEHVLVGVYKRTAPKTVPSRVIKVKGKKK